VVKVNWFCRRARRRSSSSGSGVERAEETGECSSSSRLTLCDGQHTALSGYTGSVLFCVGQVRHGSNLVLVCSAAAGAVSQYGIVGSRKTSGWHAGPSNRLSNRDLDGAKHTARAGYRFVPDPQIHSNLISVGESRSAMLPAATTDRSDRMGPIVPSESGRVPTGPPSPAADSPPRQWAKRAP
jgi:hypothetical protein